MDIKRTPPSERVDMQKENKSKLKPPSKKTAVGVQGKGVVAGRKGQPKPLVVTTLGSFHDSILRRLKLMGAEVLVAQNLADMGAAINLGADHLLLPGGADVHPAYYNQSVAYASPSAELRDELEYNLADWALREKVPTLAICRGHQMMAVAAGGTLYQDLAKEAGVRKHPNWHGIVMHPTSPLRRLARTQTTYMEVNSYHHQAVCRVPAGWYVTAMSRDGVIEGLAHPDLPIITTQFHPEAMSTPEAFRIFEGWLAARWTKRSR